MHKRYTKFNKIKLFNMVYSEWVGSSPSHIHSCSLPSCLMPKSELLAQTFRYIFFRQVEAHRFEQTMYQVLPKPSLLVRGENDMFLKNKAKVAW